MNFEELMSKYIDGENLKDSELNFILQKLSEDPSLIERFKGQTNIETLLSTPFSWEKKIVLMIKSRLLRVNVNTKAKQEQGTKGLFFVLKWGFAFTTLLILISFFLLPWWNNNNSLVLSVKSSKGNIFINDKIHDENLLKKTKIKRMSKIVVPNGGSLLLEYPDHTSLKLSENTEINTFHGGGYDRKIIFLKNGFLKADVTSQKKSMLILTVNTNIEVIGTSFEVQSNEKKTHVNLIKGKLSVTNNTTGKKVILNERESIISFSSGNIAKTEKENPLLWKAENEALISFEEGNGEKIINLSTGKKALKDAKIVRTINFEKAKEIKISFQFKAIDLDSCGAILIFKNSNYQNIHQKDVIEYISPPPRDWTKVDKTFTVADDMVSAICVVYVNGIGELQLKNFELLFSE